MKEFCTRNIIPDITKDERSLALEAAGLDCDFDDTDITEELNGKLEIQRIATQEIPSSLMRNKQLNGRDKPK